MDYPGLIEALREALRADERVSAVFLGGSRGRGDFDSHSDVDVVIGAETEHHGGLCADLPGIVASATDTVHSMRVGGLPVFTYITPDWLRFDVSISSASELAGRRLAVLFDRSGTAADLAGEESAGLPGEAPAVLAGEAPVAGPDAVVVERLAREFLRVAGLLPVVVGRGEYVVGVAGFGLLHGMLIQLLRQTSTAADPGGVLSLRPLISVPDYEALESLPAVEASRVSVIDAHLACARQFLPLARRLHSECGIDWPADMAEALRRHWRATLDVELPLGEL
ncbi:MAG: nucleotidyltransferase domain-containing protein [Stackebrandtia sp.]